MIKTIELNYPTFGKDGLKLKQEFNNWINILEENNGWGKSTILNTIISSYTLKFPWLRTLPEWSATIHTDNNKLILSKWNWIGLTHETNELYKYIVPWKFFDGLTTPQQRKILVDLLWLDYEEFIKTKCNELVDKYSYLEYREELEKYLNDKMKTFVSDEKVIIEDIQRLQVELRDFDVKTFEDIDRFNQDKQLVLDKIKEYNKWIIDRQTEYTKLKSEIDKTYLTISNRESNIKNKESNIILLEKQLEQLRSEYSTTNEKALCDKCGSELHWDNKDRVLEWLRTIANKLKNNINSEELAIEEFNKANASDKTKLEYLEWDLEKINPNFNVLSYDDYIEIAIKFDIDLIVPSQERLQEQIDYNNSVAAKARVEQELNFKKESLKKIDTLKLQESIDKLKEIKQEFTRKLEDEVKSLPLDIELFKLQKNGEMKETFTINYNGLDYSNQSNGNKNLINIMLAKLFIDKLWLDFMLIDEASNISKDNLWYIKELSNKYQIILAKATWWNSDDFI